MGQIHKRHFKNLCNKNDDGSLSTPPAGDEMSEVPHRQLWVSNLSKVSIRSGMNYIRTRDLSVAMQRTYPYSAQHPNGAINKHKHIKFKILKKCQIRYDFVDLLKFCPKAGLLTLI